MSKSFRIIAHHHIFKWSPNRLGVFVMEYAPLCSLPAALLDLFRKYCRPSVLYTPIPSWLQIPSIRWLLSHPQNRERCSVSRGLHFVASRRDLHACMPSTDDGARARCRCSSPRLDWYMAITGARGAGRRGSSPALHTLTLMDICARVPLFQHAANVRKP